MSKKRYWKNRFDARVNVSYGENVLNPEKWYEITYDEYKRMADEILKVWAR